MSRCTVILGAGASVCFGAPLLKNVFVDKEAFKYLRSNQELRSFLSKHLRKDFDRELYSNVQELNVEDVISYYRTLLQFEDSFSVKNDNRVTQQAALEKVLKYLNILIKKAVFDNKNSGSTFSKAQYHNKLITYLDKRFDKITWATLNWDCFLESSFYHCLNEGPISTIYDVLDHKNPKHHILKLHGGINWWFDWKSRPKISKFAKFEIDYLWRKYEEDIGVDKSFPLILEPSSFKYEDPLMAVLSDQWVNFYSELIESETVFIIGYSLPKNDKYLRAALVLAFEKDPKKRCYVIDPFDVTSYEELLNGRGELIHIKEKYSDFSDLLYKINNIDIPVPEYDLIAYYRLLKEDFKNDLELNSYYSKREGFSQYFQDEIKSLGKKYEKYKLESNDKWCLNGSGIPDRTYIPEKEILELLNLLLEKEEEFERAVEIVSNSLGYPKYYIREAYKYSAHFNFE